MHIMHIAVQKYIPRPYMLYTWGRSYSFTWLLFIIKKLSRLRPNGAQIRSNYPPQKNIQLTRSNPRGLNRGGLNRSRPTAIVSDTRNCSSFYSILAIPLHVLWWNDLFTKTTFCRLSSCWNAKFSKNNPSLKGLESHSIWSHRPYFSCF